MKKKVYSNLILDVYEEDNGNIKSKKIVTLNSSHWVNIIPLTEANEIVFVKQFRHGINRETLEIPGGMVDINESPMEAAKRELFEETGYVSRNIKNLGNVSPNPALFSNRVFSFLGLNSELKVPNIETNGEISECVLIKKDRIPKLIKEGIIDHALVVVAFKLFDLQLRFLNKRS